MVRRAEDTTDLELEVWRALALVYDPEIPPCSITDLGIVERVRVTDEVVEVDLLPTFAGCPALDVIRKDAEAAIGPAAGSRETRVRFVYSPPWTSDRISLEGRDALQSYGLTPPGNRPVGGAVPIPLGALRGRDTIITCPFCGSQQTDLESAFGPTLCRSTHFCRACRNPFEAFKPKLP